MEMEFIPGEEVTEGLEARSRTGLGLQARSGLTQELLFSSCWCGASP